MNDLDVVPANPLLDLTPGVGVVASTFQWDLLDRHGQVTAQLHPQTGASLTNDTTATVYRQLRNLVFRQDDWAQVDPFEHRVRPWMVLSDGSRWPLGIFLFTADIRTRGSLETPLSTTMLDQRLILSQTMPFSYGIPDGGFVRSAMLEIIGLYGISDVNVAQTGARIGGGPVSWAPDASGLTILESLAQRAGFWPPYFDNRGTLLLRAVHPLGSEATVHHYDSPNPRVLRDTLQYSTNLLTAPNAFRVISSGTSGTEVYATAYVDAAEPYSRENRGVTITKVIRRQGLPDQASCRAVAAAAARAAAGSYATVEFSSVPDPRHDTFDTVDVSGELWREMSWTMALSPGGDHQHRLAKTITGSDEGV